MKSLCFAVKVFILILLLFGCAKIDTNNDEKSVDRNIAAATDSLLPNLETYSNEKDDYVVVLLGYGYNEGSNKDLLLSQLSDRYGFAENGGIIIPFVYPDDFISFGYERISLLPDNIEDVLLEISPSNDFSKISAIVTLGAPDATHFALARIQDLDKDIQIFSVFSQDDILGTEAGSTLTIDYSINQAVQQEGYETLGEIDLSYPGNTFDVISPLINAGLDWEKVNKTGLIIPALRSEYAKKTDCSFLVYIDPQTGLRAENHFVLQQND